MSHVHLLDSRLVPDELIGPGSSSRVKPKVDGLYLWTFPSHRPCWRLFKNGCWHFGDYAQHLAVQAPIPIKPAQMKFVPGTWHALIKKERKHG